MPDWNVIAGWAGGIATVLTSVAVAIWLAINRALQIAKTVPPPITKTDIVTADSVAYDALGRQLETNTLEMVQTNRLLAEIVTVGRDFTEMMRRQREEEEFEAEVTKRIRERDRERRRKARSAASPPRRRVTRSAGDS